LSPFNLRSPCVAECTLSPVKSVFPFPIAPRRTGSTSDTSHFTGLFPLPPSRIPPTSPNTHHPAEAVMSTVRHNPAAIAVATLIYFFLGAAWFTMFMNPWLAGIGRTMAELKASGAPPWLGYVIALVMTAILAVALSWIIQATGPQTAVRGATIA